MLLAIEVSLARSPPRMPRTSTPAALNGDDASAWPSTIGTAMRTPGDAGDALRHRLIVGERRFQRLHQQVAVEAEDLAEQFLAEAVHHRHDDDQGGDAQHDAEEGEAGDDRYESFLAPRPQVAQRQHPFERGKRPCPGWFAHQSPSSHRFHPILADFKPASAARPAQKRTASSRQQLDRCGRRQVLPAAVGPLFDLELPPLQGPSARSPPARAPRSGRRWRICRPAR